MRHPTIPVDVLSDVANSYDHCAVSLWTSAMSFAVSQWMSQKTRTVAWRMPAAMQGGTSMKTMLERRARSLRMS